LPVVKLETWKVRDTMLYGIEKGMTLLEFVPHNGSYIPHGGAA
jgi:hypothetical protein